MENITTSDTPPTPTPTPTPTSAPAPPAEENRINLSDVKITDQNVALNVLVGFLNIAQRRGAYGMDEAAKIWEAVKYFVVPAPAQDEGIPDKGAMAAAGEISVMDDVE